MFKPHLPALAVGCLTVVPAAQEAVPPAPPSQETKAMLPSRNGGYLGFFFTEEVNAGKSALRIHAVQAKSCAADLGLQAGDLIEAVDGKPFANGDQFMRALWFQSQGNARGGQGKEAAHSLTVRRGDKTLDLAGGLRELDARPAVGDDAPAFALTTADGKETIRLEDLLAPGKPVVLVFGSYT